MLSRTETKEDLVEKFIVNKGYGDSVVVEAFEARVDEHWVRFVDDRGDLVFARPAKGIISIEKEGSASKG